MPTIVLLDNSLSMRRRGSVEKTSRSLLSLAIRGLDCFLGYIGRCFPLEYCSLLTFSSRCESVSGFTRDYDELRKLLVDVTTQDRSDIVGALHAMVEMVVAEWGAFAPCQVVIVTDGRFSTSLSKPTTTVPFPCRLHVVCLAQRAETVQIQSLYEILHLAPLAAIVPCCPLTEVSVVDAFVSLAETHFKPYTGVLKCAHLQSTITLSPSPAMSHMQSVYEFTVGDSRLTFPGSILEHPFPDELNICGFLDTTAISAPAVLSRHFVLDASVDSECLSRLLEHLRGQKELELLGEVGSKNSQLADKPSFRVILHGSLKCESKLALVKLSDSWFGLLSSAAATSKKSNLILTVLLPGTSVPWLGSFQYLGPKPINTDPRATVKNSFPVSVRHTLSYQSPAHLHWVKGAGLQADMGKIVRYTRKLPEKELSLIKELNKLRLEALTYTFPSLLDVVCKLLSVEESMSSPQVKPMLQYYIQFLSTNHNPQEKLTPLSQSK